MSAELPSGSKTPDEQAEAVSPPPVIGASQNGHPLDSLAGGHGDEDEAVLLQQVMRFRNPDGTETIYATLRGEFAAGERGITLYVGFCPPFPLLPIVEAEAIEGPTVKVTVAQVQNNGAQIDVELERPLTEAAEVTIEVAALPATPAAE